MNLGDPDLELVDPTPNIHSLFLHFDRLFFWTKLASRSVVRWSKRMYSCAGICSYDRGGLCDIALSEPLLKLRPRKDLVETLLHEMIHAYLFITDRDRDRDGHGPKFKSHMNRINQAAGLNISIYHDFHEEVKLYQNHWWRCNGPCQARKPHFGIVRRSMNKAPGPSDYWWDSHKRNCGGTFEKIKEPEKAEKKKASQPSNNNVPITKYINVTNSKDSNKNNSNNNVKVSKPVLKESNNVPVKYNSFTKSNSSNTIVVSKKNNIVFNPKVSKPPIQVFSGKGQTISDTNKTEAGSVVETVRNIWANKQLSTTTNTLSNINSKTKQVSKVISPNSNSNKHKADNTHIASPPAKITKIDDYFKKTATSVLKDLYGQDFVIKEVNSHKRLSVTPVETNVVNCPVCNSKISDAEINRHLDECLNKDIIKNICEDNVDTKPVINGKIDHDAENISSLIHSEKDSKNKINKPVKEENVPLRFSDIKTELVDEIDLTSYPLNKTTQENVKTTNINANTSNKEKQPEDKKLDAFKTKEEKDLLTDNKIKIEPSCSNELDNSMSEQKCPCCDKLVTNRMDQHLDECLAFFDNNSTIPTEGPSTSFETIVIDDEFDESLTLNSTGTKCPCPCCLKMVELVDMNDHLDICLS